MGKTPYTTLFRSNAIAIKRAAVYENLLIDGFHEVGWKVNLSHTIRQRQELGIHPISPGDLVAQFLPRRLVRQDRETLPDLLLFFHNPLGFTDTHIGHELCRILPEKWRRWNDTLTSQLPQ